MTYLILRRFRSYGKMLTRGMVVDESEIRSPRLRQSEGKIVPAVSSSTVPEEFGDGVQATTPAAGSSGVSESTSVPDETPVDESNDTPPKPATPKLTLSFNK